MKNLRIKNGSSVFGSAVFEFNFITYFLTAIFLTTLAPVDSVNSTK